MAKKEGKLKVCSSMIVIAVLFLIGIVYIGTQTFLYTSNGLDEKVFMGLSMTIILSVLIMGMRILIVLEREKQRLQSESRQIEDGLKTRHEMGRHLQTLQALLFVEAYDEAEAYAESLFDDVKKVTAA